MTINNDTPINESTVNETAIVPAATGNEIVANFASASGAMYCSFSPETDDDRAVLYNAMNAPDVKIADHIGQEINVRDIIVEPVEFVDDKTGEIQTSPRVILIDTDDRSYSATSYGIYNALRRLCDKKLFGLPTWPNGVLVRVKEISRGANRIFTLDVVRK